MAKKHWIYVKRGLSENPKHRERMGNAIWVYLHIIDRADWETGIVYDWRDKEEADDMGMEVRTLAEHRRKLEELGYITCRQVQHKQEIIVHKWINPRNYSGQVVNTPISGDAEISHGSIETEPSDGKNSQGSTHGSIHPDGKHGTPTSSSRIKSHSRRTDAKVRGDIIDGQIEAAQEAVKREGKAWRYRDSFPECLLPLADACAAIFGAPAKKMLTGWLDEIGEWYDRRGQPVDVHAAWKEAQDWNVLPNTPYGLGNAVRRNIQRRIEAGGNGRKPVQAYNSATEQALHERLSK